LPGLSWAVSPALAQQTIAFPVSAPPECTELAQCENVPTLIENKYQAALARIKLARLSGAEPIVAQCKQAVERLKAATRGKRNVMFALALPRPCKISRVFMYPWPVSNFDYAMDDALDIAMGGGAVQRGSGYGGGGHSYRVARRDKAQDQLANAAIKAVEEKVPCAREPISRQLFGPYSGCVTCRASK